MDQKRTMNRFVRDFATLGIADVAQVGGKNASLGTLPGSWVLC